MKKNFDCEKCSHNKVCKNIEIMLEIKEKIETREHNIEIPEDSFDIAMNCKHYKLNWPHPEPIKTTGNIAQKS